MLNFLLNLTLQLQSLQVYSFLNQIAEVIKHFSIFNYFMFKSLVDISRTFYAGGDKMAAKSVTKYNYFVMSIAIIDIFITITK